MTRRIRAGASLALVLALGCASPVLAQDKVLADSPARDHAVAATLSLADLPAPKRFVSRHQAVIGGAKIAYTATAGETYLTNLQGEPIASVFSFAYIKDAPDPRRPVLFVFNGGPGSSSLWLHMGVVGPRRVALDRQVNPSNIGPFALADNPDSLLDVADLVFIDPVGTGFSRILGKGRPEDFFGVDQDADTVAQFIELWLGQNGRWTSPKYVMGESYGSTRAAVLPRALMGGPTYTGVMRGITVNGIVLLGTSLDGAGAGSSAPEWGPALDLPGMAATAWAHGKVDHGGRILAAFVDEVTHFAQTDYVEAQRKAQAGSLSEADRAAILVRLTAYTSLPAPAFGKDLRISKAAFAKQLLAKEGLDVGMYDSRYTLPSAHSGGEPVADDPAMGQYVPGFVAAFHQMLSQDLHVDMDRPYGAIVWRDLLSKWQWQRSGVPEGQSYAEDLAVAMRRTPRLQVLVAGGDFDLVTPPAAARHSLEAASTPQDRVRYRNYESGHMLYIGDTAPAFARDVRDLIRATSDKPAG